MSCWMKSNNLQLTSAPGQETDQEICGRVPLAIVIRLQAEVNET